MHLQLTTATATAPGAGGAAATAVSGDSLTTLNGKGKARIVAAWGTAQTAGFCQLAFPSGHDTTRGYRVGTSTGVNPFLLPPGLELPITFQEVVTATIAGSGTAGDVEQMSLIVAYDEVPGLAQRYTSPARALKGEKFTSVEASITSSAGPNYSGTETIATDSDLLLPNRDYAVMGYQTRTAVHAVGFVGPDTANTRVAGPGVLRPELTSRWFLMLSSMLGAPLVPVINTGNKTTTNLFVATDENAGTFVVTLHLALL